MNTQLLLQSFYFSIKTTDEYNNSYICYQSIFRSIVTVKYISYYNSFHFNFRFIPCWTDGTRNPWNKHT